MLCPSAFHILARRLPVTPETEPTLTDHSFRRWKRDESWKGVSVTAERRWLDSGKQGRGYVAYRALIDSEAYASYVL